MAAGEGVDRVPRAHPRRVLLAVTGMSPQVLTETLYALAVAATPERQFIPTEVHVVTTRSGARAVRERLLGGQPAPWLQLQADYGIGTVPLDEEHLHVACDAAGRPLDDIRTAADNACMADAITEQVRQLTSDPQCALHVSLAGGRKTMGYYAGHALSIFGRPQDRLSHVLVPAAYEARADFFYPTPASHPLRGAGGAAVLDARDAVVELADIPFVRLRPLLPPATLTQVATFAEAVAAARVPPAAPSLQLDVEHACITADGVRIALTPTQFALMAALAQRAREERPALAAPLKDAHDPAWATEVLDDLRRAVGVMHVDSRVQASLSKDCTGSKVSPQLSRLRKLLREHLGSARAALYFDDGGTHRHKRYAVPLPPQAIRFIRPGDDCKLAVSRQPSGASETSGPS